MGICSSNTTMSNKSPDSKIDILMKLPDETNKGDVLAATSTLQQRANEIRNQSINWQSYLQSQMIGDDDYHFITDFINSDATRRGTLLADQRTQCAKTFLRIKLYSTSLQSWMICYRKTKAG